MKTSLFLCLVVTATFASGLLLYRPLRADGPCFELAPMYASAAFKRRYGNAPRQCKRCACDGDGDCLCPLEVVNITLNTRIMTARNCTRTRYRCADDFDLVRKADGSVRETRIGQIRACADACEEVEVAGGKYTDFQCEPDDSAEIRNVYASHYVLTGKPCPHG